MKKNLKERLLGKKKDNKGFTLVEFLAAVGILGVVSLTVATMMNTSSRTYTKVNTEATMQAEAQVVANGISERIIDCSNTIDYAPAYKSQDTGNKFDIHPIEDYFESYSVAKESIGSKDPEHLHYVLQVTNKDERYLLVLNQNDNKIYYYESYLNEDKTDFTKYNEGAGQVLADHVKDFDVKTDRFEKEHIIWFELTYEKNGKEIKGTYQVNVRNHIEINKGSRVDDTDDVKLTSLTVMPAKKFANVIENQVYDTTDIYAYKIQDDPTYDFMKKDGMGAPRLKTIDYLAVGRPSNAEITELKWTILPDKDTGASFLTEDVTGSAVTLSGNPRPTLVLDDDGSMLKKKSFYVTATAQDGISGKGEVIVRKATGISLSHEEGLSAELDETTNISSMTARRNGRVIMSAAVDGWNLEDEFKGVHWYIEYRNGSSDSYKKLSSYTNASQIASVITNGKTCSMTLGTKAGLNAQFRVTAVSEFDRSVRDTLEFRVRGAQDSNGNKVFARGVDIDLAAYFLTYGYGNFEPVKIYKAWVYDVPNYDAVSRAAFEITNNYYLFFGGDSPSLKYNSEQDRIKYFYGEISGGQMRAEMDYMNGGGIDYSAEGPTTTHFYFPAVTMYKTTAELLNNIHTYNNTHNITSAADLDTADLEAMRKISTTNAIYPNGHNIVVSKGNSTALRFYLQSFNILKREDIGVYVNFSDKEPKDRGDNIALGGASGNSYLSASLTSSLGSRTKLVDNGVVTLRASSDKVSRYYPLEAIPLRVCLNEFYLLDNEQNKVSPHPNSYTDFNVYIANVQGANVFAPAPDSSMFKDSKGNKITLTTSEKEYKDFGPSNITVKLWQKATNSGKMGTFMKYNNVTYIYNVTYHYWQEQ
ncbi:MAG: prepilin-type N-terminal cleavage/methylation domain-containing protein [Lachnospiraceae bacterium]|jgi:prepilin-type N-terminal cleavage/methylation domain-containing protein|nr:prepilin-type N-terminal cleavage/methylation domain-containing protein [Lachnospiraceae bacterium]